MKQPGRKSFRVAVALGASHLLSAALLAQPAATSPALAASNSTAIRPLAFGPPALPVPVPPLLKSGISFFRELLAMTAFERQQALTNYPPAIRTQILGKVREYESLPPDERELRLRVTELHSYLRPLMTAPATNRASQLAGIPDADRRLVEDRLQEWDKLAPEVQKELLENEATLSYLAQIEGRTEEQRRVILTNIPPARRETLEKGISRWNAMSENQRRNTLDRFNQFFKLTGAEREKALRTLSEPERRQIEKTLQTFGSLQPDQRAACLRSFEKFTSLSLPERLQFFKDAERWQQMSPAERQAWRDLVRKVPPPLPPLWPPLPTRLPPATHPPLPAPAVATNGN
jgi:hypothetical protein